MRIKMDYHLAMAAAHDAATRRMRKAGRETWNVSDWNAYVKAFSRLWDGRCVNVGVRLDIPEKRRQ